MFTEEKFLGFLSTKRALKPRTLSNHKLRIAVFVRWLREREITKDTVQEFFAYLNTKDQKNGTYNAYLATLRLVDEYFIDISDPRFLMTGYKNRNWDDSDPIQIFTEEEIKKLLSTTITYRIKNEEWEKLEVLYLLFTRFLYFSGCRVRVEGINLRVRSYDPGTHKVWFTNSKGKKRRVSIKDPILQQELPKLMEGKTSSDYLFTTPSGRPIDWQTFWSNLKKRAKLAGTSTITKPHALRHSRASHLYLHHVPLEIISLILGHKDVSITFKTYVHVVDDPQDEAMARVPLFDENVNVKTRMNQAKTMFEGLKLDSDERLKDFYKDIMMVFLKYA